MPSAATPDGSTPLVVAVRFGGIIVTCVPGTTTRETESVESEALCECDCEREWLELAWGVLVDADVRSGSGTEVMSDVVRSGSPIASLATAARATTNVLMSTDATAVVAAAKLDTPTFSSAFERLQTESVRFMIAA